MISTDNYCYRKHTPGSNGRSAEEVLLHEVCGLFEFVSAVIPFVSCVVSG